MKTLLTLIAICTSLYVPNSLSKITHTKEASRILISFTEADIGLYEDLVALTQEVQAEISHQCTDGDIFQSPVSPKKCSIVLSFDKDLTKRDLSTSSYKVINERLISSLKKLPGDERLLVERRKITVGGGGCGASSGSTCGPITSRLFARAVGVKTHLNGLFFCTTEKYEGKSLTQGCFINLLNFEKLNLFATEKIESYLVDQRVDNRPYFIKSVANNLYAPSCEVKEQSKNISAALEPGASFTLRVSASDFVKSRYSNREEAAKRNTISFVKKSANKKARKIDSKKSTQLTLESIDILSLGLDTNSIECQQVAPQGSNTSIDIECTNLSNSKVELSKELKSKVYLSFSQCNTL